MYSKDTKNWVNLHWLIKNSPGCCKILYQINWKTCYYISSVCYQYKFYFLPKIPHVGKMPPSTGIRHSRRLRLSLSYLSTSQSSSCTWSSGGGRKSRTVLEARGVPSKESPGAGVSPTCFDPETAKVIHCSSCLTKMTSTEQKFSSRKAST